MPRQVCIRLRWKKERRFPTLGLNVWKSLESEMTGCKESKRPLTLKQIKYTYTHTHMHAYTQQTHTHKPKDRKHL